LKPEDRTAYYQDRVGIYTSKGLSGWPARCQGVKNALFSHGRNSTILEGDLYAPLRDPSLFTQVRLDADFDPATLHNWPEAGPAMKRLAAKWSARGARAGA
jgi:hypothetical protein